MAAENLNFSEAGVQEALRKNIMVLWNVYKFYEMFAADSKNVKGDNKANDNILDQWILAKLELLIKEVTSALESYNLPKAVRPLTEFIDELSNWYLRRSRDRIKSDDELDKARALLTTKYVLLELAKLMAPVMPFMAETLWQKVSGHDFKDHNRSVHLEKWPEEIAKLSGLKKIVTKLLPRKKMNAVLENMALTRKIVELGLAKRDEAGIKIRQRLATLRIKSAKFKELTEPSYLQLLKDEINVAEIVFLELGEASDGRIEVELDTNITPELKQEGIKREIIRFVNLLRKDANLSLGDRTKIYLSGDSEDIRAAVARGKVDVLKDTLSTDLSFVAELPEVLASKEIKIDGAVLTLGLTK